MCAKSKTCPHGVHTAHKGGSKAIGHTRDDACDCDDDDDDDDTAGIATATTRCQSSGASGDVAADARKDECECADADECADTRNEKCAPKR